MTQSLAGKSILIVEDEVIIGMLLCTEISRAGGTAIGPASSVARGLEAIESQIVDAAILDAKLIDGSGADLAAGLEARGIPYVVVSGYEEANLPQGLRNAPFLSKPVSLPLLMEALEGCTSQGRRTAQVGV